MNNPAEEISFPKLLRVTDVAEILEVPLSTVYHWVARGEGPPSFKVGKHRRFDAAEVAAWLETVKGPVA